MRKEERRAMKDITPIIIYSLIILILILLISIAGLAYQIYYYGY